MAFADIPILSIHGSAFWPRTWLTPLAAPGGVTTVSLARTDGGHIEGSA